MDELRDIMGICIFFESFLIIFWKENYEKKNL